MANYHDDSDDKCTDDSSDDYDVPSGYYDMADRLDSRHIFGNF